MALVGSLNDIDVAGLIELARQTPGHNRLLIHSGGAEYYLYVSDGEIVHAQHERESGPPVVFAALERTGGTFELEKGAPPPPKTTIALPWNTLLLQGLQHIDETRAGSNSPTQLGPTKEITMASKERLEDVLKEMANDMEPGLRGIAVAGTDGMGIAFHKIAGEAAENLGSQMALIMQLSRRSAERLEKSDVEDVLLTSDKSYMLGRFLGDGNYFVVVNVDRDSVLGNVRLTVRNYADRMFKAVPGVK
jgi:predicted regulator of Ras-like GTPase activity (Roadblock/LC7/MglB family)